MDYRIARIRITDLFNGFRGLTDLGRNPINRIVLGRAISVS
jgi:hypothetical protein